jgi:hypothetical protein
MMISSQELQDPAYRATLLLLTLKYWRNTRDSIRVAFEHGN